YYFFKVGKFIVFNKDGSTNYVMETLDKTPAPAGVIETSGGSQIYTTNPKQSFFLDAQVVNNKLYLLNNIADNDHHCIDIYNLVDKSCEGSIKLDALPDTQLPVSFAMNSQSLIVIYEDLVLRKYTIVM